jgi:hypothetical protein
MPDLRGIPVQINGSTSIIGDAIIMPQQVLLKYASNRNCSLIRSVIDLPLCQTYYPIYSLPYLAADSNSGTVYCYSCADWIYPSAFEMALSRARRLQEERLDISRGMSLHLQASSSVRITESGFVLPDEMYGKRGKFRIDKTGEGDKPQRTKCFGKSGDAVSID